MNLPEIPAFRPHPLLRGGHAQTLGGVLLHHSHYRRPYAATRRTVLLDDGDQIVLHDDQADGWEPGDRVALLAHGLAGCHNSGYMRRVGGNLNRRGIRTFRMDSRGCGAGFALARRPTHSGRLADMAAAIAEIERLCPGSPIAAAGFSLGGNVLLNLLAGWGKAGHPRVDFAVAVCPPVDLIDCSGRLRQKRARLYDRYFIRRLLRQLRDRRRLMPEAPDVRLSRVPTSLWDFDDLVTAPLCGFGGAEHYYRETSPAPRLAAIEVRTLIVSAADDPLVPTEPLARAPASSAVERLITRSGGHLGFIGRRGTDPDRRWLDWRIVEWFTSLGVKGTRQLLTAEPPQAALNSCP